MKSRNKFLNKVTSHFDERSIVIRAKLKQYENQKNKNDDDESSQVNYLYEYSFIEAQSSNQAEE